MMTSNKKIPSFEGLPEIPVEKIMTSLYMTPERELFERAKKYTYISNKEDMRINFNLN